MDLLAFKHDRSFILDALRSGEIDYLEHMGEAMEATFFRQLMNRQIWQRLAEDYPARDSNADWTQGSLCLQRDSRVGKSRLVIAMRVFFPQKEYDKLMSEASEF